MLRTLRLLLLPVLLLAPSAAWSEEPQAAPTPAPAAKSEATPAFELPPNMALYYMVFLKRGPKWTPEVTAATTRIQEGHMANIQKMADAGKLVVAGPFLDDGELRGIFIFKVATKEEAEALMNSDPAVQAGRLIGEIHPWMTDARVINTGFQTPK